MNVSFFRDRKVVFAALAALLITLRLVAALYQRPSESIVHDVHTYGSGGDAAHYDRPAWNLVQGHGYSNTLEPPHVPSVLRTPAYPLFLAAIYAVFGHETRPVCVADALLEAAGCLLLYAAAKRFFRREGTALAFLGALVVLSPAAYYIPARFTEPLAFFLVSAGIALAALMKDDWKKWAALGATSGALLLCRPAFAFLPLAAALLLAFWPSAAPAAGRKAALAAFVAGCLLLWTPWVARNWIAFGEFIPLARGGQGLALWFGTWSRAGEWYENFTDADGETRGMRPDRAYRSPEERREIDALIGQYAKIMHSTAGPEISVPDRELKRIAWGIIRDDPAGWLLLRTRGTLLMLRQPYFFPTRFRHHFLPFHPFLNGGLALLFGVGIAGGAALALRREERAKWAPVLLVFFYGWAIHFPTHGEARYLVPIYGAGMLLAFLAFERAYEKAAERFATRGGGA